MLPVPMLLVLAIAWLSQSVPKPEHPVAIVSSASDTLRAVPLDCPPAAEPSCEDSLQSVNRGERERLPK